MTTIKEITVEGRVKLINRHTAFLDTKEGVVYPLNAESVQKVMQGDQIRAIVSITENGKNEAVITDLIEPGLNEFVGRVVASPNAMFVEPDHPTMKSWLYIPPRQRKALKEGDWVYSTLGDHPFNGGKSSANIKYIIARKDDVKIPWLYTIAKNNLDDTDIEGLVAGNEQPEFSVRRDLTALSFVTIDAASTRDMDDALHAEELADKSIILTVAIADPTAFIKEGSEIDNIAKKRMLTAYLPGKIIPMIPKYMSDDVCSLKSNEVRPSLCCQMIISENGEILKYEFFEALIKSQAKLSYDEVSDYLDGIEELEYDEEIKLQVKILNAIQARRFLWRENNNLVFKDEVPDFSFELSGTDVTSITAHYRRIGNQIVEEAMIAANISCSKFLIDNGINGIFNIHDGFDAEDLDEAKTITEIMGLDICDSEIRTLSGYMKIRRFIDDNQLSYFNRRIIKCHTFSTISDTAKPHFGMGLDSYAAFTSPIRRYSDMINHRLIKAVIRGQSIPTVSEELIEALQSGMIRAKRSEIDVKRWLYAKFLTVDTDKQYEADILQVTRGGCIISLRENGARAFMPLINIHENKREIECDTLSGKVFVNKEEVLQIGQVVSVNITNIEKEKRNITVAVVQ